MLPLRTELAMTFTTLPDPVAEGRRPRRRVAHGQALGPEIRARPRMIRAPKERARPAALSLTAASPWWARKSMPTGARSSSHATASWPRSGDWFEAGGFVEVERAALQISPGNETHLQPSRRTRSRTDGRASRSISTPRRNSPARSCWRRARRASSDFARVFRNRERGRPASSRVHDARMVSRRRTLRQR